MEVNRELLLKVGNTARLNLTEQEINKFIPQVKEILSFFEKLNKIDTTDIKPSFQPVALRNRLREDIVKESLLQELALKNSPLNKDGYFKGPKAV
ncbi:MAG: Asp-tRNA(Asn)/Glu-tRNA(Gln) amidotransferase subunit GatC [Candidatus Woesearchaeota archaeon]